MTVAVVGSRQRADAVMAQLEMSGLVTLEDPLLQRQAGFGGVAHGIDPRSMTTATRQGAGDVLLLDGQDDDLVVGQQPALDRLAEAEAVQLRAVELLVVH